MPAFAHTNAHTRERPLSLTHSQQHHCTSKYLSVEYSRQCECSSTFMCKFHIWCLFKQNKCSNVQIRVKQALETSDMLTIKHDKRQIAYASHTQEQSLKGLSHLADLARRSYTGAIFGDFRGSVLVRQRNGITLLRTVVHRQDIVRTSAKKLATELRR
jgi:hypothetical protein